VKKSVSIIVAIALVIVAALWFFNHKKPPSLISDSAVPSQGEQVNVDILDKKKSPKVTESNDDSFSELETQVLKAQVQNIADQYADTARFPIGSQPIRNLADAKQPEPYEETEVETPFETESGETIGVSAAVDRFQYFSNDTINIRLELSGVPEGAFVEALANIAGPQGDTPLSTNLNSVDASQSIFVGALDTSLAPPQTFSKEMIVKISIEIAGEPFFTTVAFNYDTASARLVGLGVVQPSGANLEIPFEYSVLSSGYYFVSAILNDQQTGRPLVALQTEGRMSQGNGRLIAKAHIQALKAAGSEGPYVLTNIRAYRGAERGEQFDVPASSVNSQYTLSAFSFSDYADEVFEDPLAQERAEFLIELGGIENQGAEEQGGDPN